MINLIRSDLYKMFRSKAFYICVILCMIMAMMSPVMLKMTQNMLQNNTIPPEFLDSGMTEIQSGTSMGMNMSSLLYDGEVNAIWYTGQTFAANIIPLFLAIFITIFVASEFSTGAMKNIVSKGFKRSTIYLSKLVSCSVATIIMFFAMVVAAFFSSSILFGIGEISTNILLQLLAMIGIQLMMHLGLSGIFIAIAFIFRKMSSSLSANILIVVLIVTILSGINLLIKFVFKTEIDITQYWILGAINKISEIGLPAIELVKAGIIGILYLVVTSIIGIISFNKKDII